MGPDNEGKQMMSVDEALTVVNAVSSTMLGATLPSRLREDPLHPELLRFGA